MFFLAGQIELVWQLPSKEYTEILDFNTHPTTHSQTQLHTFMINESVYRPNSTYLSRACVVVYQSPTDSSLLFTHVHKTSSPSSLPVGNSTNSSMSIEPLATFHFSEPRLVPLINPEDKDYLPLSATSILGPQNWLTKNYTASDSNGAATIFYQTTNGKIVASVFDHNALVETAAPSAPPLIRSMCLRIYQPIFY